MLDASKSVGVSANLLSDKSPEYSERVRSEYLELAENHANRTEAKAYISYSAAIKNGLKIEPQTYRPNKPGITVFEDYNLSEIRKYIDWTPFFSTWMLKGKYPGILENPTVGKEAQKLYDDAQAMLDEVTSAKFLKAKAVVGLFEVERNGDDLMVFKGKAISKFHFLRQQGKKAQGVPNLSLIDFLNEGSKDYLGGFAVTAGIGIEKLIKDHKSRHDDYNEIMVKALADRLAEAFAELMHERVRKEFWGYAAHEDYENESLIKEKYQGIRPAPGYPACPDHTEKRTLFDLLEVEKNTGITLTESFAMYPASSVSGLYFAHPEAKYFGLGKIGRDQVENYANRKGTSAAEAGKWLAPNLNYEL